MRDETTRRRFIGTFLRRELVAMRRVWRAFMRGMVCSVWRIALFQNTPAAFHGRPEAAKKLSAELRDAAPAEA